jgi:hypothetical protein
MSDAYDFVQHLSELGVPIFTAKPATSGGEFTDRPNSWSTLTTDRNAERIGAWSSGDALVGLMGGSVAVVDVDPRNGGDVAAVRAALDGLGVTVYGEVLTPGGGWHFYVAGHAELPTAHKLTGYPGVDVQSFGAVAYLPGTQRPKYDGAGYVVMRDNLEALADGGDPDGAEALAAWVSERRANNAEKFTPSDPWSGDPPTARQAAYLAAVLRNQHDKIAAMRADSGRNTAVYEAAMACGNYIAGAGMDEAAAVDNLYDAATRCHLVRDDGERSVRASIASGIRNGKHRPRAVPDPTEKNTSIRTEKNTSVGRVTAEDRCQLLAELLDGLREWQDLPDPTHVIASLATAATVDEGGEACWLLMVAPPSSGKTEAVRLLDDAADARLDEVTSAGLLGWSKGKTARPTGVLSRIGDRGLVTFGDLSSLLATSDRGGRDQVFGLLRKAYDGHVTRDVSPPGRTESEARLEWSGRLTVVACVTGAIDRYQAHNDALGPRWVYVRIPDRDTMAKRRAAKLARRVNLTEKRNEARGLVVQVLEAARQAVPETLPEDVAEVVEDVALVTAWGRGSVPRNGYGRREIEGVPVVEEPMRLVQQLSGLARGILALGLPEEAAAATVRRVGLDSMPAARRAVLVTLANGEVLTTAGLARGAGLDRKVARMTLEELAAVGIVEHDRPDEEYDDPTGAVHWRLLGDDGALVAHVVRDYRRGGWDETWVSPTPPPQIRGEDEEGSLGLPTLRPTPDSAPDLRFGALLNGSSPREPALPPPCVGCGEQLAPERAAVNTRCSACWDALCAAQPKETADARL